MGFRVRDFKSDLRYFKPIHSFTQNRSHLSLMELLQQTKCSQIVCILCALATLYCTKSQNIPFFILRIFRFSSDLAYPPLNFENWVHIRVHCKCFKNFLASYKLCTTFTEINNTKRLNPKSLGKDWWKYIHLSQAILEHLSKCPKKVELENGYIMYQTNANK